MRVFFDASVLLAGLRSTTGGSSFLLLLSEKKKLNPVISRLVLEEIKRNIKKKFSKKELLRLAVWMKRARPKVVSITERDALVYKVLVPLKDTHVLAAANKTRAKYLVTLDKKHLLKIAQDNTNLSFKIVTPKELINLL